MRKVRFFLLIAAIAVAVKANGGLQLRGLHLPIPSKTTPTTPVPVLDISWVDELFIAPANTPAKATPKAVVSAPAWATQAQDGRSGAFRVH